MNHGKVKINSGEIEQIWLRLFKDPLICFYGRKTMQFGELVYYSGHLLEGQIERGKPDQKRL